MLFKTTPTQCCVENDGYRVLWVHDNEWLSCEDFDKLFELV